MSQSETINAPTAPTAPKRGRLLRVQEALDRLACGKTKFYGFVADGRIPVVRLGASSRVPEAALEAFIAGLPTVERRSPMQAKHAA